MKITFSYPFSKLFHNSSPIGAAKLIQVIETDFSDLAQEFIDYDTDFGQYQLPKVGPCIILIFLKKGGIFTTIRDITKGELYRNSVGQVFDIELEHNVPEKL